MSVLGRKSLAEAGRSAREVDQSKLATAAVKLEGRDVNSIAQTDALSLGENPKNKDESKWTNKCWRSPRISEKSLESKSLPNLAANKAIIDKQWEILGLANSDA
jgi:hypothetical protein